MKKAISAVVFGLGALGSAQAALIDRGNGLIYDNVANLTWMQDANLAAVQNFGPEGPTAVNTHLNGVPGQMNWDNAMGWVYFMNAERYKGYADWRLPTTSPAVDGYNQAGSELGNMFFNLLGNKSDIRPDGGFEDNPGLVNSGPFRNVQASYWSGSDINGFDSWWFSTANGYQGSFDKTYGSYAWVVRDGDVASVPEPQSYLMMIAGIGLLALALRRGAAA